MSSRRFVIEQTFGLVALIITLPTFRQGFSALFQPGCTVVSGPPIASPNLYLPESVQAIQIRSDTPSTVIPHPQQKSLSPGSSPYFSGHHGDGMGHHTDVAHHHHHYGDNNNENDYYYGHQMPLPTMQQPMQGYYYSCPNSPEMMTTKTLTQLNGLTSYPGDSQDQVR